MWRIPSSRWRNVARFPSPSKIMLLCFCLRTPPSFCSFQTASVLGLVLSEKTCLSCSSFFTKVNASRVLWVCTLFYKVNSIIIVIIVIFRKLHNPASLMNGTSTGENLFSGTMISPLAATWKSGTIDTTSVIALVSTTVKASVPAWWQIYAAWFNSSRIS